MRAKNKLGFTLSGRTKTNIVRDYEFGWFVWRIAERYGCDIATVRQVLRENCVKQNR